MASKPKPSFADVVKSVLSLKRGFHGCEEANTISDRAIRLICYTGESIADEYLEDEVATGGESESNEDKVDAFPPLVETKHAPLLDALFVNIYKKEGTLPPAAHLLYVCVEPKSGQDLTLKLEIIFLDEREDAAHEQETQKVKQTYAITFDNERKTPDEELYLAFLFVNGESARSGEFDFEGLEVIDVSDDSPHGFPEYLTLWVENYDTVKKTLIFVETSPEMEIVDDLEDDLDDEDLSNDPADMPPELDDWPWRVQPSGPWLA